MAKYQYSAGCHPDYHAPDSRYDFPASQPLYNKEWRLVVTDLAEDYHADGGYENSWPVQFRIYEDSMEVARFDVEREYEPSFYVLN